ncbi:MAG: PEP-CTERM sorting domain-containing protein [Candidatus Competibacteraceae bacterium]
MFDLLVDGTIQPLLAGTEFNLLDLNPDGFSSFGIRGIDVGEALDPNDPLAFVTGLSFVDSGNVSMHMIPVTVNVPEPTTIGLVGLGLAGFVFARRRRKLNA